ncbi:MAG: 50S ribosomal protein L21 [Rhodospirillaceae bacterium]|nr:50S ribosomal protein L21 [Rhodospirillaceae bacterium]
MPTFAVIRTGGKQYRVAKDDVIKVERLDAEPGSILALDQVLMVGGDGTPSIGAPLVDGATVSAEVVAQTRGEKILVFKKKRRKKYQRTRGHRQDLTVLKITDIAAGA